MVITYSSKLKLQKLSKRGNNLQNSNNEKSDITVQATWESTDMNSILYIFIFPTPKTYQMLSLTLLALTPPGNDKNDCFTKNKCTFIKLIKK